MCGTDGCHGISLATWRIQETKIYILEKRIQENGFRKMDYEMNETVRMDGRVRMEDVYS